MRHFLAACTALWMHLMYTAAVQCQFPGMPQGKQDVVCLQVSPDVVLSIEITGTATRLPVPALTERWQG